MNLRFIIPLCCEKWYHIHKESIGENIRMGDIMNVVTSATADKTTVNRHGPKEHLVVIFLLTGEVIIQAWEDHKYIFWMSKTKLQDKQLNAEIFDLVSTAPYDYVAYEYKLTSLMRAGQPLSEFYSVELSMKDFRDGAAFAEKLVQIHEEIQKKAIDFENTPSMMRRMHEIQSALVAHTGTTSQDAKALRPYLEDIWKWTYLKLSPNTELRGLYSSYSKQLSHSYNAEMSRAR